MADWIPEMTDRIVREYRPLRIVLFESPAGEATANHEGAGRGSVGLLVVLPDSWRGGKQRNPAGEIVRRLRDIPVDKNILVSTPTQLARHGHLAGTLLNLALRVGTVLYQRE